MSDPRARRALALTTLLLVLAAAALAGGAALGWLDVRYSVPLRGTVEQRLDGSHVSPELTGLALLVLAAVAAVLATGGWLRRLLGPVLLLVAATPVVLLTAGGPGVVDRAARAAGLPSRAERVGEAQLLVAGPLVTVAGLVLLTAAALLLVWRGHRMPRMGARYSNRPVRDAPTGDGMWQRLDAGDDPTLRAADPGEAGR